MSTKCNNCISLKTEVDRLRQEVALLKAENGRLNRLLLAIARYARTIAETARNQMKNVPKGKWAYLKGSYDVGESIYDYIRRNL